MFGIRWKASQLTDVRLTFTIEIILHTSRQQAPGLQRKQKVRSRAHDALNPLAFSVLYILFLGHYKMSRGKELCNCLIYYSFKQQKQDISLLRHFVISILLLRTVRQPLDSKGNKEARYIIIHPCKSQQSIVLASQLYIFCFWITIVCAVRYCTQSQIEKQHKNEYQIQCVFMVWVAEGKIYQKEAIFLNSFFYTSLAISLEPQPLMGGVRQKLPYNEKFNKFSVVGMIIYGKKKRKLPI